MNGPTLNLLFIGDVVGKGGRKAVKALVPRLKQQYMCTFVVANGENCAAGAGLNKTCLGEMSDVQLWDTTMNPEKRRLRQITIENAAQAERTFSMLMGDDVPPRRQFIEENAHYANIDA